VKPVTWLTDTPIAHRGLHDAAKGIPENSLAAFDAARARGFPIELDVRLSRDNHVMVFHDADLRRMTHDPHPVAAVEASVLRALRLGATQEHIPTLVDVLDLVGGAVPLFVEIKNESRIGPLEAATAALISAYQGPVAVMSFNPYSLGYFKTHAPGVPRGQLSGAFTQNGIPFIHRFILKNLLMNRVSRPQFIGYDIRCLPFGRAERLRRRGTLLIAWTVRNARDEKKAKALCDNMIFEGFIPEGAFH
jgi:glycerophosphoryl diester phosphodiesterase